MSATIDPNQPGTGGKAPGRRGAAVFIFGACALVLIVGLLSLVGPDLRSLRQSSIGFAGLEAWLKGNGVAVETVTGGLGPETVAVGLRILPLFDDNLHNRMSVPRSDLDRIKQTDEADITIKTIQGKIETLPTLLILPKWRAGMRLSGKAHPTLALPDPAQGNVQRPAGWPGAGGVTYAGVAFGEYRVLNGAARGLGATLYYPQIRWNSGCRPIIGEYAHMILGECERHGAKYWLLSDPDLLNSHGLRLGDNAEIALRLLPELAGGKTILLDYTTYVWMGRGERGGSTVEPESRNTNSNSRDDRGLERLFAYPLSLLWAGVGILLFLVLWRGLSRFGPAIAIEESAVGASKEASIVARARLLRLSGHDGDLLRAHLGDRLQALVEGVLGGGWAGGVDPLDLIVSVVRRRDAALASEFREAVLEVRGLEPAAHPGIAADALHRFEISYRQVMHEFGRTLSAR